MKKSIARKARMCNGLMNNSATYDMDIKRYQLMRTGHFYAMICAISVSAVFQHLCGEDNPISERNEGVLPYLKGRWCIWSYFLKLRL